MHRAHLALFACAVFAACGPVLGVDTSADTGAPADTDTDTDTDAVDTDAVDTDAVDTAAPATDFRLRGPHAVSTTTGTLTTTSGCDLAYALVEPAEWEVLVVLLHGFMRTGEQQVANAEHLASFGVAVAVPTSCHATAWDIDQEQNGLDAVELSAALGRGSTIYAGHSAGGLAAFVATAHDPSAVAFLGFDPTEANGVGGSVSGDVDVPAYAAVGEGGTCNVNNNFLPMIDALPEGRSLRVTDADHCDFEDPTDWVCTVGCGTESNDRFEDGEIRATIRGLAAAFVAWQSGLDPSGEAWWTPSGAGYAALRDEGAIAEP